MKTRPLYLIFVGMLMAGLAACGDGAMSGTGRPTEPGDGPDAGPPRTDTIAPSLESVGFSPTRVNVFTEGELVFIAATVTDVGSGVVRVTAQFRSPEGAPISAFTELNLTKGDPRDGRYEGSVLIPRGAPQGNWELLFVEAADEAGNTRTWNTEDLRAMGKKVTLVVSS